MVTDVKLSKDPSLCLLDAACLEPARSALGVGLDWPSPGAWLTVSAFRTLEGAENFMAYLREMTPVRPFAVQVARQAGSTDIGLGQEAAPDGSGPLVAPLENQQSFP